MQSDFEGTLGQLEEGIEKVAGTSKDIPELLKNSYENIKLLFEGETVTSS
jgi:hypothetical protein